MKTKIDFTKNIKETKKMISRMLCENPDCHGFHKGIKSIKISDKLVACDKCGLVYYFKNFNKICDDCGGIGYTKYGEFTPTCKTCNGTGHIPLHEETTDENQSVLR